MNPFFQKIFPEIKTEEPPHNKWYFLNLLFYSLVLASAGFITHVLHVDSLERITELLPIIITSFVLHAIVRIRFRPALFVLTFVIAVYYAFGFFSGFILLGLILLPFLLLNLKISGSFRLLLIVAFLVTLGCFSFGFSYMPRLQLVIPYAAALLMFRSVICLYEAKHHPMNENFWLRLSYFFCVPNLAFLFFPIVDYRTHINSYYNTSVNLIWKRGSIYILFGIAQFLLYRIIHNKFSISTNAVHDAFTLSQLIVVNYFSLLKISGTLTAGAGFVCFFGYNLPAPFGNYFFSDSFGDYWRKVNIYWREFMMKLVYYPVYFAIRKKTKWSTELSIIVVFICSIFFHWYQKFWITGLHTLSIIDIIFWCSLGALIILNQQFDLLFTKQKTSPGFFKTHLSKAAKTSLVFLVMSILIWLWESNSWSEMRFIISKSLSSEKFIYQLALVISTLFVANLLFSFLNDFANSFTNRANTQFKLLVAGFLLLLFTSSIVFLKGEENSVYKLLGAETKTSSETEKDEADYYETIFQASTSKWQTKIVRNNPERAFRSVTSKTGDLLMRVLRPSAVTHEDGYLLSTNSYGMRDKEYSLNKSDSVFRGMLLGTSYEMGSGVEDSCVFENITERALNNSGENIELLNYSMGLYSSAQHVYLMDKKVSPFHPDVVFIFSHTGELERFPNFFTRYIRSGVDLCYAYLNQVKERSGVNQTQSELEIKERLRPYTTEMVQWCYDTIAKMCKEQNIEPIWFFVPTTNGKITEEAFNRQLSMAQQAGFICYSLADAFKGYNPNDIQVSETDSHPNCLGHHLLSEKFSDILQHKILKQWKEKHSKIQ